MLGGYWSTYFYAGRIYGTEIVRGLDVFALEPSEFLSENEIAAAALADQGNVFNPQQQFPVTWPAEPVVARAYIDQLNRDAALAQDVVEDLDTALNAATAALENGGRDRDASNSLRRLARGLDADSGDAATANRLSSLADTLEGIAARLR